MNEQLLPSEDQEKFISDMQEQIKHAVRAYNLTSMEMKDTGFHMGALITASLTTFVQLLSASGYDTGKTVEEVKDAIQKSVGMMDGFVDALYQEFALLENDDDK